jgi:hypothetical protein
MGKLIKVIAGIAILVVGPKIVQKAMGWDEQSQTKKLMATLIQETRAKLPVDQGQGITLTAVDFENKTFRNTYVVGESSPFSPSLKSQYEKAAVTQVCNGPYKELTTRGITVEFRYKYKEQGFDSTLDISLPPSKCA